MRSRRGFTLIEVLIAMAMLSILAALAYPAFTRLTIDAEQIRVVMTVRDVRNKINLHQSIGDVALSSDGHPDIVNESWFPGRRMPKDPWTSTELKIQVVNGPKAATEPNNKTFMINPDGKPTGHTAWYNRANGAFCMKVPDRGSEQYILDLFHSVNGMGNVVIGGPGGSGLDNDRGNGNGA